MVEKDIKKLAERFAARPDRNEFQHLVDLKNYEEKVGPSNLKDSLGLERKPTTAVFKTPGDDGRVFPGYFAPIITGTKDGRAIRPMRYRIRPSGSAEEIPSKINVYNARKDNLDLKPTWRKLLLKKHGVVPFIKFYEWVPNKQNKTELVSFEPRSYEIMWAACLWDTWESKDGKIKFSSFAIVTDESPVDIKGMGQERCPIFLKEKYIDQWLHPKGKSKEEIFKILESKENVLYGHEAIAE